LVILLGNLAISEKCQYKNETYDFTCDEPAIGRWNTSCIFHDINYLKGDNHEKHKEQVTKRFEKKLSKHSSDHGPLKFLKLH
jgi:hypothetical protein